MTSRKYFTIFVLILSFALSIGVFVLRDNFKEATKLGLFGIFLINLASSSTFFVSGPAFLTVIAGGSIYPPLLVALVASLGAAAGDMVSFFLGFSGRNLTEHKLKKKLWFTVLEDLFKAYGTVIVFIFAIIPNPVFDAIGLVAGVLGFKPLKFFALMLTGRFARFVILALIGARFY